MSNRHQRFIPAYAGNSSPAKEISTLGPVHPRLRGELRIETSIAQISYGSSPLTRGTLKISLIAVMDCRFIPAYAGNSCDYSEHSLGEPVHPRLRGELPSGELFHSAINGSSPLTRGTRNADYLREIGVRFIPAYAGNSLKMVTTLH